MEEDLVEPSTMDPLLIHPQKHADNAGDDDADPSTSKHPLITNREYDAPTFNEGLKDRCTALNTSSSSLYTPADIDDGLARRTTTRSDTSSWWAYLMMVVRARRRHNARSGLETYKDEFGMGAGQGLLADSRTYARRMRRKRSWYHYCIFCGISGSSILAILLVINLGLISATAFWTSDYDPALRNWGSAGSGTEGLDWYPTDFTKDVIPIPCHSHNDYWRRVPLFSALRAGCTGTEADVWLFDEELYVGHNSASLTRNRTFQSLYINPLVKILEQQNPNSEFYNGTMNGVFDTFPDQSLILLVDVKTTGIETWPWVLSQLEPLRKRGWLTFVENGILNQRPITVVGTGNTPFDLLTSNTTYRDTFFDAPLETMWEGRSSSSSPSVDPDSDLDLDLDTEIGTDTDHTDAGQGMTGVTANSSFTPLNSYYASVPFGKSVGHIWSGRLSRRQRRIIRGQVRGAHRRGLKVRYWDLPAWPIGLRNHVWDVLVKEGVDMLNVDDLRAVTRMNW